MARLIIDRDETTVVDHAGWQEEYHYLWRYRVEEEIEERLDWPGREFTLHPARDGIHVTMVEREDDGVHRVTIRLISEIETVLAAAIHSGTKWSFDGPRDIWALAPPYVLVDRMKLLHVHPDDPDPDPLAWYEQTYDTMYQGLGTAYAIPGGDLVIITVQRDSNPVIYDPVSREVKGHVPLANRGGNPSLFFREDADELWADDYDTLLRLSVPSWKVLDSARLQPGSNGTRSFIGSFWFSSDENICVVARPFSGDAAIIDATSFAIV